MFRLKYYLRLAVVRCIRIYINMTDNTEMYNFFCYTNLENLPDNLYEFLEIIKLKCLETLQLCINLRLYRVTLK